MTQNYAKLQGGAVLNNGTLTVSGGTITDNCAENNGGVYVRNGSTIKMYDDPVIKENAGSNLVLAGSSIINVDYYFTSGAEVDISAAGNMPRAVTSDFGEYHSSASVFTFGSGRTAATLDANGEIVPDIPSNATHVTTWNELKSAVNTNNAYIVLDNNITNSNQDTLTVKDSSVGQKDKITGGNCTRGGAIYIFSGAVMNLESGSISGNTAAQDGGGIWNCATLNIEGGSITDNVGIRQAGGVYVRDENSSVLNVRGEPVIEENQAPIGNNILLCEGKAVTITGTLYPTSKLDVVTKSTASPITSGYSFFLVQGSFTYNGKTGMMEEKNGELYLRQATGDKTADSWTALQNAINSSNSGEVIVLTADVTCDNNSRLTVENKTVTIELNGHKIDRNRTSSTGNGQVFGVMGNSHLTISDVAGTGVITGGFSSNGGGIFIDTNATVTINGGSVQGNTADSSDGGDGGGVYNKGILIMNGGAIAFNKADDTGGGIYCTDSGTIQLDNALITGNYTDDDYGGGMNLHLKGNSSFIKNSYITNNRCGDNHDGGIRMDADQRSLTIENTHIEGNTASNEGGGIKLTDGTLKIYNSYINHNTAEDGAGIYTENGSSFYAENTEFCSNTSTKNGAGGINGRDKVTLISCKVNKNTAKEGGAGIYFDKKDKTLTLTDTEVKSNMSTGGQGGVYVTKNTDLYVEEATYTEGGVEVHEPVTFVSNHADQRGGAILLCDDGSLYLRAITVTNDYSATGAIHADEDFYISGSIIINKGSSSGLYMEDDADKLHIDGALATDSHIDVELEYKTGSFTEGFKEFHDGADPLTYFSAQEGYAIALDGDGEVKVKSTDWFTLQQAIDHAANGDTITLTKDYEADDADSAFVIPEGKTLTLDLHGYKLNGSNELKGGTVLKVNTGANLTIEDNYVFPNNVEEKYRESFEGAITGGTASAIVNRGTLTIKGGKIQNNTGGIGGGINNYGTLTITGGKIKANSATQEGGGIHNSGTLDLYGGEIKNNTSASSGGGIFCAENSRIYVKDAPKVKENNGAAGKNIVLSSGVKITLNGTLAAEAKLDIALKNYEQAITSGYASQGSPQGVFTYNENEDIILAERDGELYFP